MKKIKSKIAFLFITFLMISGCQEKQPEGFTSVPPGIISRDSMVNVLVDVQLVESALKVKHRRVDEAHYYARVYYDSIFRKHKISYPKFDSSLKYYQTHELKELEAIYEDVLDSLNRLRGRINSE